MKPILFRIFDFGVPSYSVLMVLGYAAALWTVLRLTPSGNNADAPGGLDRWQVRDLYIVMVVASVIGAKVGHTLFEAPGHIGADGQTINSLAELLAEDPWHWMRLGESGYVWYGGMLGALATAAFYFWRRPKLNAWLFSDVFAPAIMLGAFLGRMGCFLAGCCYGKETDAAWAVQFPQLSAPVHPTQLYDAGIAIVLGVLLFRRFPKRKFDGEIISLLLISYPVLRASTEVFRGDADRGSFGVLSTSQMISIPLLAIGIAMYVYRSKKGERTLLAAPAT